MQEIRDKFFDYAGMVKAIDPNALIAAPEEWGWTGYFYSGFDQQWASANGNWNPAQMPDRGTNGGLDYMPWFLDQAYRRATNTNQRLLDIFTLHIYPQGGEYPSDTSVSTQLRRNRSTRALWDTNYVDETWIGQTVKLIPRMKSWVAAYYPGTRIGITEYNWGSEDHINGATAQADIFGIFGREGLDLATRWTTPAANTPTYKAMKMYRNYDNNKSGFGETSVLASAPNPDQVSAFAAVRASDGALTAMVINKQLSSSATAVLTVTNFPANGIVQRWQLTAANTINQLTNVTFSGTVLSNTVPAQSVTLFVFQAANPPHLRLGGMSGPSSFNFWLDGQTGQRYVIEGATNLVNWVPVQTNTLASNSLQITVSTAGRPYRFFRAQWAP
jgi:hypothetical protein